MPKAGKLKEFVSAHAGNTADLLGLGLVWAFEHSVTLFEHFPSSNLTGHVVVMWNAQSHKTFRASPKGNGSGTKARQFAP